MSENFPPVNLLTDYWENHFQYTVIFNWISAQHAYGTHIKQDRQRERVHEGPKLLVIILLQNVTKESNWR